MRNTIKFILDEKRQSIHFVSDINNLKSNLDLWLSLDSNKSLFENVEYILKNCLEAHNITAVNAVNSFDYEVVYNLYEAAKIVKITGIVKDKYGCFNVKIEKNESLEFYSHLEKKSPKKSGEYRVNKNSIVFHVSTESFIAQEIMPILKGSDFKIVVPKEFTLTEQYFYNDSFSDEANIERV